MDVPDILQTLVEDGVIDDVRARLMSGKEASVFVVERGGELLAAKVYKEREQRTFKATASYTEGRNQTRNSRDKRAMGKRTSYGKELVEASWRDMEYAALLEAFTNGVRVPEPILLYDNVLLMELLVDEGGAPAPRLADFDLPAEVAGLLHREIYGQVRLLLRCGKIHGDLSAFNILIARGGPTIIDMPQVVDASGNNSAPEILRRDLANVTEHLARFDSRLLMFRDCGTALWNHYRRGDIDSATEPEEGGLRRMSNQGHKGRRAREAERGRAGRERNDRPTPERQAAAPQAPTSQGARPQQERPQHDQRRAAQHPDRSHTDLHRAPPQQDHGRPPHHNRPPHDQGHASAQRGQAQGQHDPRMGSPPQQDHRRAGPPQDRAQQQDRTQQQRDRHPPQERQSQQPRAPQQDQRRPGPQHDRGQQDRSQQDQRRPPPGQERGSQDQRPLQQDQRRGPAPQDHAHQVQRREPQDRQQYDQRRGPETRDRAQPDHRPGPPQQEQRPRAAPQQERAQQEPLRSPPSPQERRPLPQIERKGPQIERVPSGLPPRDGQRRR